MRVNSVSASVQVIDNVPDRERQNLTKKVLCKHESACLETVRAVKTCGVA